MLRRARQHVEFADAMHHAGQKGLIGIDRGTGARQHECERGDQSAALPQILEVMFQTGKLVAVADLYHRKRDRGAIRAQGWPIRLMQVLFAKYVLRWIDVEGLEIHLATGQFARQGSDELKRHIGACLRLDAQFVISVFTGKPLLETDVCVKTKKSARRRKT